jgi:hypothetical protein
MTPDHISEIATIEMSRAIREGERRCQLALNADAMQSLAATLLRLADETHADAGRWEKRGHSQNFADLMLESHRLRKMAEFYRLHAELERDDYGQEA